jgi:hypothetical protein
MRRLPHHPLMDLIRSEDFTPVPVPTTRFTDRFEALHGRSGEFHDPAGPYQKLALVWEALFRKTGLAPDAAIAEIAPGDEPKIALALEKMDFHGRIYLVEPHTRALASIVTFYRLLLPRATVVPVEKPIAQAYDLLPRKLDGVFANHPLDDMILEKFLETDAFHHVFTDLYDRPLAEMRALWDSLLAAPDTLLGILSEITGDWSNLIARLAPRRIGIAQYESMTLTQKGFTTPDRVAKACLEELKKSLGATPSVLNGILKERGSIPEQWLFLLGPEDKA